MSNDVFISYSRRNKTFVQKLNQALVEKERQVWVDWDDIPLTADWWAEIQAGIEGAHSFVFIISPDSVASKVCGQELDHAIACNKRIIPVVYRNADSVPDSLSHINWLFFRDSDGFDTALKSLLEAIDTDLDWIKAHTRLTVRAQEWVKKDHNESYLLRGDDLAEAEKLLGKVDKKPRLTLLQSQYILNSRRQQEADRQRELEAAQRLAQETQARLEAEEMRSKEQAEAAAKLRQRAKMIIGALAAFIVVGLAALFLMIRTGDLVVRQDSLIQSIIDSEDAVTNEQFCWFGTLNGVPGDVLPACDKAIELDPKYSSVYESRGLALALLGNYELAIKDFQKAIEVERVTDNDEDLVNEWDYYIEQLQNGQDPFDDDLLAEFRRDNIPNFQEE
ncbi:MAG: TIR domain-containing protein [Anaerolineales bacterium]|nr:TIR domain-containing protein [Anaerolineales bacterium]